MKILLVGLIEYIKNISQDGHGRNSEIQYYPEQHDHHPSLTNIEVRGLIDPDKGQDDGNKVSHNWDKSEKTIQADPDIDDGYPVLSIQPSSPFLKTVQAPIYIFRQFSLY